VRSKIAKKMKKGLPAFESYEPLNISQLPPNEFITRLYAQLTLSGMFGLDVLDL
jgi:hypothetical protein